jgi:uncharacterized membrane protein (UPF0127 family)
MRRVVLCAICLLLLVACYDTDPASKLSEDGFQTGRVLLGADDDDVLIDVEIAETQEERAKGLMNRESLPEDAGMMFVYFEPTSGGFWMKDTLIPLSIAFIDEEETITQIIDMEPCSKDPCRVYSPDADYVAALEVNQGAFDEWGVDVGDTVRLLR